MNMTEVLTAAAESDGELWARPLSWRGMFGAYAQDFNIGGSNYVILPYGCQRTGMIIFSAFEDWETIAPNTVKSGG